MFRAGIDKAGLHGVKRASDLDCLPSPFLQALTRLEKRVAVAAAAFRLLHQKRRSSSISRIGVQAAGRALGLYFDPQDRVTAEGRSARAHYLSDLLRALAASLRPVGRSWPEQGSRCVCEEGQEGYGREPPGYPARPVRVSSLVTFQRDCPESFLAKKENRSLLHCGFLERAMGFEPTTPTLARLCSTPELRPHPWIAHHRALRMN